MGMLYYQYQSMNNTNQQLGALIKQYRESLNMTQTELAQTVNLTRQAISLWEQGQGIGLAGWAKFKWYLPEPLQKRFEEETKAILTK